MCDCCRHASAKALREQLPAYLEFLHVERSGPKGATADELYTRMCTFTLLADLHLFEEITGIFAQLSLTLQKDIVSPGGNMQSGMNTSTYTMEPSTHRTILFVRLFADLVAAVDKVIKAIEQRFVITEPWHTAFLHGVYDLFQDGVG
jgi:hypothetical protein